MITNDERREDSRVVWIHRNLVLRGITDETFGVRERYIGWGSPVTLVVGNDLNSIILPNADTAVGEKSVYRACEDGRKRLTSRWCPSQYRLLFQT